METPLPDDGLKLRRLRIENYKGIDSLELDDRHALPHLVPHPQCARDRTGRRA